MLDQGRIWGGGGGGGLGLGDFLVLQESSENQFGQPKKTGRQNFLKIRPPLEKILDPPLCWIEKFFMVDR